jgi:hypothetical protein
MSGHRECEPQIHATRVMFYRSIDKSLDFCKGNDLVKFAIDLLFCHAEDGSI